MKWKTILAWGIPIVGAIGLIIWVKRGGSNKEDDGKSPGPVSNATDSTAAVIKPPPANSSFPLRIGSRNSYVTDLQKALGIAADGIFGAQTEQALKNAAGISAIKDEKEFKEVIAKIKAGASSTADIAQKIARADDLKAKFATGKFSIRPLETKFWYRVQKDAYGAYNYDDVGITLYKSTTYNNDDYSIADVTKLGNIIIYINKGTLLGSYIGDPRSLTLV